MQETPLVSICCLTYNHKKYIRDAIEGFLMQKTNFPIEVLIHDDASNDGTADIIREYEAKHPEIIKPIYQTENQWSKGIKPTMEFNFPRARGKYIALCEGDDYWTDPYKLQKQVDFLEKNGEYSMICHRVKILNTNHKIFKPSPVLEDNYDFISSIENKIIGKISTLSLVFRNKGPFDFLRDFPIGDYPLKIFLAKQGKIKCFREIMGVYRLHRGGIWSYSTQAKKSKTAIQLLSKILDWELPDEVKQHFQKSLGKHYFNLLKHQLNENDDQAINSFINATKLNPQLVFEAIKDPDKLSTTPSNNTFHHQLKAKLKKWFFI